MNLIDLKCSKCGHIFEHDKKVTSASTPTDIKCPKCGSKKTKRYFPSSTIGTDVARGYQGNASTGYSKEVTYHKSTKFGSYKGTKI